jgi:hypothetical protein
VGEVATFMPRRLVAVAMLALAAAGAAGAGVSAEPRPEPADGSPILVHHQVLRDGLARIWRRSPSWRAALDQLAATDRRVYVLTPDQVVVRDAQSRASSQSFDPAVLAEASPVSDAAGRVSAVLVVVNLPLIEALHERRGSLPAELDADLDSVLAHEVYGHAVPVLLAGDLSGRCADPAPGQPATEACAVRRENVIRSELRLGRRTNAGHDGLLLAFRGRH